MHNKNFTDILIIFVSMSDFTRDEFDNAFNEFDGRSAEEVYDEFLASNKRANDGFVSYYGGYLDVMRGLSSSAKDLLSWMAFNSEMNTGRVLIQSFVLKDLLKSLGITSVTFYRALGELKSKMIVKGGNAKYYLNPLIVWKGTSSIREGFLKVFPRF